MASQKRALFPTARFQPDRRGLSSISNGATIAAMTGRARVYTPIAGWRLARWLLFYVALVVLDAAAFVAVIDST